VCDKKRAVFLRQARSRKKGDPPYAGKSHYVDENKPRKNVTFRLCHYVYENNGPMGFCHYIIENKAELRLTGSAEAWVLGSISL
jgi:phage gp16-like protein